jgi:hypothetical protein
MDQRVRAAARNNAAWCDAVSRSHGHASVRTAGVWTTSARPPAGYPDAVTLEPTASPRDVLARIDAGPGCSIKDSFSTLDLRGYGFEVLFDAEWYHRDAGTGMPSGAAWAVVRTAAALAAWERAHSGCGVFRPALLGEAAVRVLVRRLGGGRIAGAVASRGGGVAGLSNLFTQGLPAEQWDGLVLAVERLFPGLSIVGYDAGDNLWAAVDAGFTPIGPLRVWLRR